MNYTLINPEENSNKDYSISEEQYNALSTDEQALYEKEDDEDLDDFDDDDDY